jgi:hypothetical protein
MARKGGMGSRKKKGRNHNKQRTVDVAVGQELKASHPQLAAYRL